MHCSALCMCQCECECALAQAVKIVDVLWNCQSHRCAIEYVFQRGLHKYCVSNMHLNHVTQWSFHDENWSIGCRFRQLMALIESVLDRACYRARIVCTAVRLYGTWLENTAFNASIFIHSKCHLHAIRQFVNLNKLLRLSMTCFFFCFFFLHSFCYSFIFNQNYRCTHENLNIV